METVSAAPPDDSSGANPSSVKSDDSSPRHESGRGSPPPNCAICLGTCRNKSFTDSCLHQFCFKCLLQWSRVKAECPLCKQNFKSIIHNVRSNHQYEEYLVEQRETEESIESYDFDHVTASTRRFRYRTTLTLPRHDTIAIQQLLLRHYPLMADVFPAPRRQECSHTIFRRTVYRLNLWARPLPDVTGRFRDCTPEFYRYNTAQMHRLLPWLNRELNYLLHENVAHVSYVISRIMELLPRYQITSLDFRQAVQTYFRNRTDHFVHELYCFASTPYDMTGYDRNIQYSTDESVSTIVNEVISSTDSEASVDSDIVIVSSSGPTEPPPGPSRLPAPIYPQNHIPHPPSTNNVIPIETLSNSDTDDNSSEVMVVGYIKPPQDRTPEVVDLVGSDSDVIVQDTTPPNPPVQSSESQEARHVPLVKLILKRHAMETIDESDSEDSTYRPPPPRRKRKQRSNTATTADTSRTTPSPKQLSWDSDSVSSFEPSGSVSSSSSSLASAAASVGVLSESFSSSESSIDMKRNLTKKKYRKKHKDSSSTSSDKKRYKKRKSRSHRRDKQEGHSEKSSKRKSTSGKGVKSSKKKDSDNTDDQPDPQLDQPSTSNSHSHRSRSRIINHRQLSRESKRLKSVVNVMYNQKSSGETSSSGYSMSNSNNRSNSNSDSHSKSSKEASTKGNALTPKQNTGSDSEDDLPLNLSTQKTYTSL